MKKVFLSLVAVAAIAACTKSEVEYDAPAEIGFAPVAKLNTRAAVADTDYPDALNMYVFANAGLDGTDDNTTVEAAECTEAYLKNAEFAHGSHATNVFGGVTPYYWPNVKSLVFSGYSKSGNASLLTPTYVSEGNTWVIKMAGYTPGTGTDVAGNNDLMWFPTTTSYTKPATAGTPVSVEMKHACAWVTIKIKGDTVTGKTGTSWKIKNVSFNDLSQSGNVTLGNVADWTSVAAGTALDVFTSNDGKQLTETYVDYTQTNFKDLVIVPQTTKTLYITYQFESQSGLAPITETKALELTYSGGSAWNAGMHYTYNITLGTSEILIQPTLDKWDAATDTDKVI